MLLVACAEEPQPEIATRVVTVPVKQEDVTIFGKYVGRTEASERVEVNPRVDGFLEAIEFVEGSAVDERAVLYRIDARPYQANLDRVQATLASKRAILAKFKRDVERIKPLFELETASAEYLRLARSRYRNGVLAYLDVLDAQRRLFEAQLGVSFARENQFFALVDLYIKPSVVAGILQP